MGCNAYNHPADCDCGFGGDTGGGGRPAGPSSVRYLRAPDGLDWHGARRPAFEAYVNPNARCPVCGADVFFYQSADGGRVFFDELGPPWPKHPCTDAYLKRARNDPILPAMRSAKSSSQRPLNPNFWQPLIPVDVKRVETWDRVILDRTTSHLPGRYIYVPADMITGRPTFWRRSTDPSMIDVSTIADGNFSECVATIPAWFNDDEEVVTYAAGDPLDAKTLNAIGWSLSFAWRTGDRMWTALPAVDLPRARSYFEAAAKLGWWEAWRDLAVMAIEGIGRERDLSEALNCFRKAVERLELMPLESLEKPIDMRKAEHKRKAEMTKLRQLSLRAAIELDDQKKIS